jgi:DMSO/TMAO reductase YedYZ molybdopterin-dependent catalytic subunit
MNRRTFVASVIGLPLGAVEDKSKLLLPTDIPDEHHLRTMWFNPVLPVDRRTFRLSINGLVEKPKSFSLDELRKLPQDTQSSRMKCVQGWSARIAWGGFRFGHLMEAAKPAKAAKAVRIDCADKWYEYFSIEDMLSNRVMMVLDMAGKPLTDRHGGPLRLIDPARYGYKSAKLITSVSFVPETKGSMACDLGPYYSPGGEILAGYDTPLDLGGPKRKVRGGEITDY